MAEYDNVDGRGSGELCRLFTAALIGGIIGVAVGLLIAPKAGAELRVDLRDKADSAVQKAQGVSVKAKDLVRSAKEKIEERRAGPAEAEDVVEPAEGTAPEIDN